MAPRLRAKSVLKDMSRKRLNDRLGGQNPEKRTHWATSLPYLYRVLATSGASVVSICASDEH